MFGPTRYLDWARRHHGKASFDLASSGVPPVSLVDLGVPSPEGLDDVRCMERFKQAIARYNDVPPEQAVPALGTSHALWLAYATLTRPGDEVLVESPAYEPLLRAAEGTGASITRFERPSVEGFRVDPARVVRAMTDRTRVVALSTLHNPTGVRADEAALREVAREVEERGAHLLVDEVYAPFDALVGSDGIFRGSARRLGARVLAVGSLTKCYGLGLLRVGWLLAPENVARRAEDVIMATAGLLPVPHAAMALRAFNRVPSLAVRSRSLLEGHRAIVESWATARGYGFSGPREGPFGLVTIPGAVDLTPMVEAALREHDVLVTPGAFFDLPGSLRVAWTAPKDRLEAGLERLARALEA